MLDALAPLTEVMEQFNSEAEEVSSKVMAKTVEDAIKLLGNASSQMSSLCQTWVLQEYNKELVAWAQHGEDKFIEEAPAMFGPNFPRDITEYSDQVTSLKKAKVAANHHLWVFTSHTLTGHQTNLTLLRNASQHPTHKCIPKAVTSRRSLASDNYRLSIQLYVMQ